MNTVCGVCNPFGGPPAFVVPIVRQEESCEHFIQIMDDFDQVSSFEQLHVIYQAAVIEIDETSRLPIAIGMPGIYGFQSSTSQVLIGTLPVLANLLNDLLTTKLFADTPF